MASATALVLLGHRGVPNRFGRLGSLVETFLPWTGALVVVLLLCAALRRSAAAAAAAVLSAVVWATTFGGTLVDKRADGGNITVVTHNVREDNPDPAGTARAVAAADADVVALQELNGTATAAYRKAMDGHYAHRSVQGTVGLWSRYPITDSAPLDIAPWPRALRATVRTPHGPVAVYAVHLPSVRLSPAGFGTRARDSAALRLAAALHDEPLPRVVVVGDLNGTVGDRGLSPVTSRLRSAQAESGAGFGFSWPAAHPVARIDEILLRGITPRAAWNLPATGSDHLPVMAALRL
nr:endonuclease/exonuclease/phosphatase family protein [Streptomyces zhihengii]